MQNSFYKFSGDQANWQRYQSRLKREAAFHKLKLRLLTCSTIIVIVFLVGYNFPVGLSRTAFQQLVSYGEEQATAAISEISEVEKPKLMRKNEVRSILDQGNFCNLRNDSLDVQLDGRCYKVETSLDLPLQTFLLDKMNRNHTRYIGIVAIEPTTGRVLAMTGFDRTRKDGNPCIEAAYPAASVFKIVTAAAGIEKCGFQPSSKFALNGGKYTLYRSQLKDQVNRYTIWMSLKESFAMSVNPIFGKIGAKHLGPDLLEQYAEAFGFNRNINFELPLSQSRTMTLSQDTYELAEIASGFNRETTLSPLHGALMSATILNKGDFIEPTIIDTITDENGNIHYHSRPKTIRQVITSDAASSINTMMLATVQDGTSKRAFQGAGRDRVLSRLKIGGKTGSMGSREVANLRYDWFVGFATDESGEHKMAVAAMVAHEKFIGTRAAYYARLAMQQYFGRHFERMEEAKAIDEKRNEKQKKQELGQTRPVRRPAYAGV
ncbi:MAG: penicillin-binding transpeptidase domain-containing protein [Thermodesulfobacteriota bacterium]